MRGFLPYHPDQAYHLPPNVKDVLGENHIVSFVHGVVERLGLLEIEQVCSEEGGAYNDPPQTPWERVLACSRADPNRMA